MDDSNPPVVPNADQGSNDQNAGQDAGAAPAAPAEDGPVGVPAPAAPTDPAPADPTPAPAPEEPAAPETPAENGGGDQPPVSPANPI